MSAVGSILYAALWIYFLLLIFRLIMDFVLQLSRDYRPRGLMLLAVEVTFSATDPPLRLIRRVLPPLRVGGIALDLAFLVLIIIVQILLRVVTAF